MLNFILGKDSSVEASVEANYDEETGIAAVVDNNTDNTQTVTHYAISDGDSKPIMQATIMGSTVVYH